MAIVQPAAPPPAPEPRNWPTGFWSGLWALLRQRCPRCRQGRLFRTRFEMNDPCPVCGLLFQREEGYFLGAMYAGYFLASAVLIPLYLLAALLLPEWDSLVIALVATAAYLPFVPLVFRYSRVVWIYLDRAVCGSDTSAQPYEKVRKSQLGERK
jgi:uncharacterized protein (DUF983 family)